MLAPSRATLAPMLNKSEVVLERNYGSSFGDRIVFDDPEEGELSPTVVLHAAVWEDMGRPDVITVMVEPESKVQQ